MTTDEYLRRRTTEVDAALGELVRERRARVEPRLLEAMEYSLTSPGKRIRPILVLAAAEALGADPRPLLPFACAAEMVHTYSLIHDDLPALDNDDYRRGRLTSHKVFGEAMAVLTGDALLTLAFEVLAKLPQVSDDRKARMIAELAAGAGTVGGMIAGQVDDLEGMGKQPTQELLERIHRAKTGALLRASVRIGAIYAGAQPEQYEALSGYGEHIGLAFQIVDDILDVEQTSEELGKTAGKDAEQHKITFPAVYGLEESKRMAEQERQRARQKVAMFGSRASRLGELADLIVARTK